MRVNTKFPVAVHVLALVGMCQEKNRIMTSESMAVSVGTNPVVIRRLMTQLKTAGLLETQPGVAGARLTRRADEITLLDVWTAVREKGEAQVFDLHTHSCPDCCVGSCICQVLEEPLIEAQRALEQALDGYTLADMIKEIENRSKGTD